MKHLFRLAFEESARTSVKSAATFAFALLVLSVCSACDGGDNSNNDPPPSGQGGDSVTGAERFAWTQGASSLTALRQLQFVAYVDDGPRTSLAGSQCSDALGQNGFECSAQLPQMAAGRRVLQVAAVDSANRESARSAGLVLNVQPRSLTAASALPQAVDVPAQACSSTACSPLVALAIGLERPHSLTPLPDGGMLFVERGSRVLFLGDETLSEAFALESASGTTTIADIALDHSFHESRFVFMAVTHERAGGGRTVSVLRARELQGTLGETATLIADLRVADAGAPAISVGPDGLIYLALPRDNSETGIVMRYAQDGSAAGSGTIGSPALAHGPAAPTQMLWDATTLWIGASSKSGDRGLSGMAPLDTPSVRASRRSAVMVPRRWPDPARGVIDLALNPAKGNDSVFLVTEHPQRRLYRVATGSDGVIGMTRFESIDLGHLQPAAVAVDSKSGDVYVLAETAESPSNGLLLKFK
jgi:hypothetical protein